MPARRPLTEEEIKIVRRFTHYNSLTGEVTWAPRQPEDFGSDYPEYAAEGWNSKWPGQPVGTNNHGQFNIMTKGQRYTFNIVTVEEVLSGRTPLFAKTRMLTPEEHRKKDETRDAPPVGTLRDRKFIAKLFKVKNRKLIWEPQTREVFAELATRTEGINFAGGRQRPMFVERGRRSLNTRQAGKEVRTGADGMIWVGGVLSIDMNMVATVFGPEVIVAGPEVRSVVPRPLVSEALIRKLLFLCPRDGMTVRHRPRDREAWEMLIAEGAGNEMPLPYNIDAWNAQFAGKPAGFAASSRSGASIRLGVRRCAGLVRVRKVLASSPVSIF